MALGDLVRNVLTTYKADTTQMKKALTDLTDEIKNLREEQKKTTSGFDAFGELGKKVLAVAAGVQSLSFVWESFNHAIAVGKLEAAAAGANIERLRSASLGLKSEMQLLTDAARFQSGAFKLTQQQMEVTERAMAGLTRRGAEGAKVQQAVTDAVVALKADGLKDLGVFVDVAGLSMEKAGDRAKIFERIMQSLAQAGKDVKEGQLSTAEGAEASAIALQDSWSKLKAGLGELVIAFSPILDALAAVVSAVGETVGALAKGVQGLKDLASNPRGTASSMWSGFGSAAKTYLGVKQDPNGYAQQLIAARMTANQEVANSNYLGRITGGISDAAGGLGGLAGGIGTALNDPWATPSQKAKGSKADDPWKNSFWMDGDSNLNVGEMIADAVMATFAYAREQISQQTSSSLATASGSLGMSGADGDNLRGQLDAFYGEGGQQSKLNEEAYKAFQGGQQQSYLEKTFGALEEFSGYTMAFDALSGAVGAAMNAWIDGSSSASDAVKRFIADTMKANATLMAAEALKEGAYAIGKLAIGDTAGAAAHGAAALKFGAAAAAFAVGAKALGTTAAVAIDAAAAKAAGSAAPTNTGAGSAASSERHVTVVTGNNFAEDNPRQRARNAKKLVDTALGPAGVAYSS